MPSKSVREMSALERQHYSLAARTFHAVLILSLILGSAAVIFGWYLYTDSVQDSCKNKVSELALTAADLMDGEQVGQYYDQVDGLIDALGGHGSYNQMLKAYEDEDYVRIAQMMQDIAENNHLSSIFIGMPDNGLTKFRFIVNPDASVRYREQGMAIVMDQDHAAAYKQLTGVLLKLADGEYVCSASAPIYKENGSITGYVVCNLLVTDVIRESIRFLWRYVLLLALVTLVLGFFMVKHLKKVVVTPINEMAEAAESYIQDRRSGVQSDQHFADLHISTGDEIENLSLLMADMEQELRNYEDNLTAVTAEKERIGTELNLASQIQEGMLPSIFPPFPGRSEFDIFADMRTAKEVGGDFYDFFLIDDDHLAMVMADVSGKGVPAALFMMASKILLNNFALTSVSSPAVIFEKVNHHICMNNRAEMFVTAWMGILEISSGRLRAANAGHEYPAIRRADGKFELYKDKHGFVLGGMDGLRYKEYEIQLHAGDIIFLYTDGVPEAVNIAKEQFGTDRMLEALNKDPDVKMQTLLDNVRSAIDQFAGEAEQFDDITMLALRYRGEAMKKITIEAKRENLDQVLAFVDEMLETAGCDMRTQMQLDIAVEEIFVNIASYAYAPEVGNVVIGMQVHEEDRLAEITFADSGIPYNPLEKEDPDVTLSAEEREIGGLGIFMVKKTMDDLRYDYRNGQNVLTLIKKLQEA